MTTGASPRATTSSRTSICPRTVFEFPCHKRRPRRHTYSVERTRGSDRQYVDYFYRCMFAGKYDGRFELMSTYRRVYPRSMSPRDIEGSWTLIRTFGDHRQGTSRPLSRPILVVLRTSWQTSHRPATSHAAPVTPSKPFLWRIA